MKDPASNSNEASRRIAQHQPGKASSLPTAPRRTLGAAGGSRVRQADGEACRALSLRSAREGQSSELLSSAGPFPPLQSGFRRRALGWWAGVKPDSSVSTNRWERGRDA
ncbi:MAG: hypothetical protein ACK53L_22740, partial [Pirellulaceae bacterium]